MSCTGVFTECQTKDEKYPKINDLERLKSALKREFGADFGVWLATHIETELIIEGGYPKKEHLAFIGFRTWKEDIIPLPNIERFGDRWNSSNDWIRLFVLCSQFTEPFEVFHSPIEDRFPSLLDCCDEDFTRRYVLKLNCHNGGWKLEKINFSCGVSVDITKSIGSLEPEED